jgi:hypothetical protein
MCLPNINNELVVLPFSRILSVTRLGIYGRNGIPRHALLVVNNLGAKLFAGLRYGLLL